MVKLLNEDLARSHFLPKATVPYYLKRVRDPVPCLTLLKIFLTARCETVKSHVLKRKYRTISLLRRGFYLFSL